METKDYSEQLNKSIEWAKQTRWCKECQTMTPHKEFDTNRMFTTLDCTPAVNKVALCGWCASTRQI